jgi:glycosyltransferase involved in cell wall biosynthesis
MVLDGDVDKDVRVLNEISFLRKHNIEVFVLTPGSPAVPVPGQQGFTQVKTGLSATSKNRLLGTANSLPLFKRYWTRQIILFIQAQQIDLLHAHDLYMGEPAIAAGKALNIPVVIDLHENFPAAVLTYAWVKKFPQRLLAFPEKWKKKEQSILEGAAGLIVLSDVYKAQLCEEYPALIPDKVVVYPNVPDVAQMLAYPVVPVGYKKKKFTLLYFGMIGERRGLHTASEALKILSARGLDCELVVIGKVHQAEVAYFNEKVSGPGVIHIPWIDISELRSYTAQCDVCISPILKNDQHNSGVANKIFQYMLYEKPLLVSDCTPQKAIVDSHACGMVHESENAADFAGKVEWMLKHPEEINLMGKRGKEAVLATYNLDSMGKNILELYHRILKI